MNILWLVLGGVVTAVEYIVASVGMMVTIIGIPFGIQLIKMGTFALWPFGHEVQPGPSDDGCLSLLMNVVWILVGGIEITMLHLTFGVICSITIIGIPFGIQHFKMALLALVPFGKKIV